MVSLSIFREYIQLMSSIFRKNVLFYVNLLLYNKLSSKGFSECNIPRPTT